MADQLRPRFPEAAALMGEAEDDVLAHLNFPAAHRAKPHSANPPGAGQGGRRRTGVADILPNEAAIRRLAGAVLMEQNDDWIQGRRV